MTDLIFALYSFLSILAFVSLFGVFTMFEFVQQNIDTIILLITNLLAYLAPSPRQKRMK